MAVWVLQRKGTVCHYVGLTCTSNPVMLAAAVIHCGSGCAKTVLSNMFCLSSVNPDQQAATSSPVTIVAALSPNCATIHLLSEAQEASSAARRAAVCFS